MLQSIPEKCGEGDVPKVLLASCLFSGGWKNFKEVAKLACERKFGGAGGVRTRDLLDAIEARSQLRYGPTGDERECLPL
jgi:hypothetical protein